MINPNRSTAWALATAAFLGMLVLTGCAESPAPAPTSSSPSDEPTQQETEDPNATPVFERTDPLPLDLAPKLRGTLEHYKQLTPEERLTVLSWIIQYAPEFSDRYVRVNGDEWTAIPEPSISDTPSQIYAFERGVYNMLITFDDGTGKVDRNLAEKALYAITGPSEWDDIAAGDLENTISPDHVLDVDVVAIQGGFDVSPRTIVSNSEVYTGPNRLPSMDITRLNKSNYTINETYEFRTYTDYKGNEKHAWILIANYVAPST